MQYDRRAFLKMGVVGAAAMAANRTGIAFGEAHSQDPRRLGVGPHLFLDPTLVASQTNLKRVPHPPQRLDHPIITGPEDKCFQPFVSVLRDPQTKRFRMWYGVPAQEGVIYFSRLGYVESEDGVDWIRPHRVLENPGGLDMRFGCSVFDEGPEFADTSKRYKFGWVTGDVTKPPTGGLMVATSPDGFIWTPITNSPPVLPHSHDINNVFRDTINNRYGATVNMSVPEPKWGKNRRRTFMSFSDDLIHWAKPWEVIPPDSQDEGEMQYYGMSGYLRRGELIIGLIKVLRDDLPAEPGGDVKGMGYTALAWSRDGVNWERERAPFMPANSQSGTWDRAMTWCDCQLPVGDEVFVYYGGYMHGHKVNRFAERQLGLARMKRDRYLRYETSGHDEGALRTHAVTLDGAAMTVNADVRGELRVRVLDLKGAAIAGFNRSKSVNGDSLAHAIEWEQPLMKLRGQSVQLEFVARDAQLFGFELV